MRYAELLPSDKELIEHTLKLLLHIVLDHRTAGKDPLDEYVVGYAINTLTGRQGLRCDDLLSHALRGAKIEYRQGSKGKPAELFVSVVASVFPDTIPVTLSQTYYLSGISTEMQMEMINKNTTTLDIPLWPQEVSYVETDRSATASAY